MTVAEALKELGRQEKRFAASCFSRGEGLIKSAHEYYDAILDYRRKSAVVAVDYAASKKKLAALISEAERKEVLARKLLEEVARLRSAAVKHRKVVKTGDMLKNKEHVAQLRFVEKVACLRRMEIS